MEEKKFAASSEQIDAEEQSTETFLEEEHDVAPGVPIVRGNTPRPMLFNLAATRTELPLAPSAAPTEFPVEAPDAPPLPEDPESDVEMVAEQSTPQTPHPVLDTPARSLGSEFIWLFEYALGMDPVYLNRPERLNGSAFAYGPAVLNSYRLIFEGLETRTGHVIASLDAVPDQPQSEVWGILYRVPRRFTQGKDSEISLLDKVHFPNSFVPVELQVRETYRQRQITCLTYIASETTQQQVYRLPMENRLPEPAYLKRLLQVARRQKLPGEYIHVLEELIPAGIPAATPLPTTPPEQNTEPLPSFQVARHIRGNVTEPMDQALSQESDEHNPSFWPARNPVYRQNWMMAFALYICLLLLGTLTLAVLQGAGWESGFFTNTFMPLGLPWYIFLSGLLGGCVSCLISLGRLPLATPPSYVIVTWFARPFLGTLLAALAGLFLNSGIFQLASDPAQHFALYALVSGLAGACEGKIMLRKIV